MEQTLERKVYSPWAYTENETEKAKINHKLYNELKDKVRVVGGSVGYGHHIHLVVPVDKEHFKDLEDANVNIERKKELLNEMALVADGGNLCFGYNYEGKLTSYTNSKNEKFDNVYRFYIFTD
jgi:hypothetical protein